MNYKKWAWICLLIAVISFVLLKTIDKARIMFGETPVYEDEYTVQNVEKEYKSSTGTKSMGNYEYKITGTFAGGGTYTFSVSDPNAYRKGRTYKMYSFNGNLWDKNLESGLERKAYHVLLWITTIMGAVMSFIFYNIYKKTK